MELTKQSCEDFLDVLASKEPVPGGGGAAALVGAVGVALGHMVGALTVGKKKYADVQEDILALNARAEALRARLVELVEEDARAFEPLSRAYGLPASTEEEKARKAEEARLKAEAEATAEPLLGGRFRLRFREPQRAVTPGQFAVLYDGEDVVGSGVILE